MCVCVCIHLGFFKAKAYVWFIMVRDVTGEEKINELSFLK